MKPQERRETGQGDLLRSRLDQIVDMRHPLVRLTREVDWRFLETRFGEAYSDGPGQPPLPTRLMAGCTSSNTPMTCRTKCSASAGGRTHISEEFFQHELVLDRSSLTRWRHRMGEEKLKALLQESLSIAVKTEAIKPVELAEVIIDTTVEPKKRDVSHRCAALEPGARDTGAAGQKNTASSFANPMRGWESSPSSGISATPMPNSSSVPIGR